LVHAYHVLFMYANAPLPTAVKIFQSRVFDLDSINMGILRDLRINCRTTYQAMSQKYGVTANAIRKRVEKLQDDGIIASFVLLLSPAMMDASFFFALAYSNRSLNDEAFINAVGNHRLVSKVGFDSYGSCVISGSYRVPEDLSEFSEFIRGFEGVRDCEIHPIPGNRGGAKELSTLDLRVIRSLRYNPRMSIVDIAIETGLTAKRVRSILNRLIETDIVRLTIQINPNAGDTIWVVFRISWDAKITSGAYICDKFRESLPDKFFKESHSATEPLMWADFLIEKVSDSESITHAIRSIPSVRVQNTVLPFPGKFFPSLTDSVLDELLKKAGLL
jgi:DNA-binding Lrp family transcriptional regulator